MNSTTLVIHNPTSGGGKGKKIVERFRNFLADRSFPATFLQTHPVTDLKELINDVPAFDQVVVIGGDGTINESVNALADQAIPFGIIPAGTGNDFVKMLQIGASEEERFVTALEGTVETIDLGECNGRKFLNGVGIGFDGQIVAAMQNKKKWLSGQAAYYYEVLRILSTYKERSFRFSIDQKEHASELILLTIGNGSTFGGGFKLTPGASLTDGLLDICEIGKLSPLKRYLNVLKLQNGTHDKLGAVSLYQAKSVEILHNPMLNAHIDGEFLGNPPFVIKIIPAGMKVRFAKKRN